MNILVLARLLRRSNLLGLRKYINFAYYNPKTIILPLYTIDYVVVDGCKFAFNDQVSELQHIGNNPWFEGVRPQDVVLDIGANVGAIAIPVAKIAKKVYAVEPLFDNLLRDNIILNDLHNIEVLKYALAEKPGNARISYSSRKEDTVLKTFADLKEMCGGKIDFLKCDCEGGEWYIKPEECEGIRELRFEFHIRRNHQKEDKASLKRWSEWLDENGYEKNITDADTVISFPSVSFKHCLLLTASKKVTAG